MSGESKSESYNSKVLVSFRNEKETHTDRFLLKDTESANSVSFSPDGKLIVFAIYGFEHEMVRVWDAASGKILKHLEVYIPDGYNAESVGEKMSYSPDGKLIVAGVGVDKACVWDAASGKILHILEVPTEEENPNEFTSVSFSGDSKLIVSGSMDGTVCVWIASTGEILKTLEGHPRAVESVSFSGDGKLIVSGSNDKSVRVWNAVSGECLHILRGHTDWVNSVSFSGDGKLIVSGSRDKTVRVWNTASGECLHILRGHTRRVNSVSFSGDGKHIVSGSVDRTVRVWNASTGECLHTLKGHTSWVRSVLFSPDGNRIVSASHIEVRVWEPFLADEWRELKREIENFMTFVEEAPVSTSVISLAMVVMRANYYAESMHKIKKKADRLGIQLDQFDELYNWCIGVSKKKRGGDTLETSTKRQRTKLVDSMFRLRF